jgi:hypothetical protein
MATPPITLHTPVRHGPAPGRVSARLRTITADDAGVGEIPQVMFLTLAVLAFVLVLTLAGRSAATRTRVEHAAEAAAQAAALQRTPAQAVTAATNTVTTALTGGCTGGPAVTVDTTTWGPGGIVEVRITCQIATADLSPLPLPGTLTMSGSSAAVIDAYRITP